MDYKEYRKELARLRNYGRLGYKELKAKREEIDVWLREACGEQVNNQLMLHMNDLIPVNLGDGLVYTIDLDYKLTCHGFKPEFRKYLNQEDNSNRNLTIIADELVTGVDPKVNFTNVRIHNLNLPYCKNWHSHNRGQVRNIMSTDKIIAPAVTEINTTVLEIYSKELILPNVKKVALKGAVNYQEQLVLPDKWLCYLASYEDNRLKEKWSGVIPIWLQIENNTMTVRTLNEDRWVGVTNVDLYQFGLLKLLQQTKAKELRMDRLDGLASHNIKQLGVEKLDISYCQFLYPSSIENCENLKEIDMREVTSLDVAGSSIDLESDTRITNKMDPIVNCPNLKKLVLSDKLRGSKFAEFMKKKHNVYIKYKEHSCWH